MAFGPDVDYPSLVLVGLLCFVVLGLFWGFSTSTVALGPYNYDWDGGSELRTHLGAGETSVDIARSMSAYEQDDPDGTVAVVLEPAEAYSRAEQARLSLFVSQGGTLLIASDSTETNALLANLGVTTRIDGQQVRDEENNYLDPALPRADDVADHRWVADVDALTLNNGTVLDPGDGTTLVNTSVLAYVDENRNGTLDDTETLGSRPVAVVESIDAGTVVVVSDESIFTNAMLDEDGNRQFVRNVGADHDRAIVDYSHSEPLPPLTYAYLVVRTTPLVQFLVGVAGLGGIVGLYFLSGRRIRESLRRGDDGSVDVTVDEETLAASLAQRNPDWDRERIRRVTKVIIRGRHQGTDDE